MSQLSRCMLPSAGGGCSLAFDAVIFQRHLYAWYLQFNQKCSRWIDSSTCKRKNMHFWFWGWTVPLKTCPCSKQLCACGHGSLHFFHFPLPTNYKVNGASGPFSHSELLTLHILWCIEPGRSELFLGLTQLNPTQQLHRFSLWFGVCWPAAEVNARGDYFRCSDRRKSREFVCICWDHRRGRFLAC